MPPPRTQEDLRALITTRMTDRGAIIVYYEGNEGQKVFVAEDQAFIVSAIAILRLSPDQTKIAYMRYKGRREARERGNLLLAIAGHIHVEARYNVQHADHWTTVFNLAGGEHMRGVVAARLQG